MRLKILAAALFSLICLLPGSASGFFDGLPLSYPEIYFSFFVFLAIFLTPWENIRTIKKIVFASLVLFLVFQFFSYKFLPYGWSVCAYSNIGKIELKSKCEPTTQDSRGKIGYIYDKINFTSENMPFYFMNKVSFNYYKKGEPNRKKLPFILEAQTYVYPDEDEKITIQSDKNVLIDINGKTSVYSDFNNSSSFNLEYGKINHISIKYESSRDKNNLLKAGLSNNSFYVNNVSSANIFFASLYKKINILLILILFFSLVYGYVSYFLENEKKDRFILAAFGIMLLFFSILAIVIELNYIVFFIPFSILLLAASAYYLYSSPFARKKIIPFLLLILFINSAILTTIRLKPEETIIFTGGDDELGHESFARSSFSVTSFDELLHSTEDNATYYYQPLHRYLLAILHKISGESLWGPYLLQTFFFSLAILFLTTVLKKTMGWLATGTFLIIYFLFLIDIKNSVLSLMQSPLQQSIPLILIISGFALTFLFLFRKESRFYLFFLLGIIFGASFMTRTDWLPIISGLFVFCLYLILPYFQFNKKFISMFFLILGLSIFPLFVGFRNWHVARDFSIMPSAGNVNLSRDLLKATDGKIIMNKSSFSGTIKTVFSNFSGRYGQLAKILANNVKDNMIGKKLLRKTIWYCLPVFIILAVFMALKKKLYYLLSVEIIAVISFFSLVIPSSIFYLHNGIAMQAIYDLLAVLILSISFKIILSQIIISEEIKNTFRMNFKKAINFVNIFGT